MLQPLLSRPPSRVRTLLIVLVAVPALLGVTMCTYLLLIPLILVNGPARWLTLLATLAVYGILAQRCIQNSLNAWRNTRAIALDHIMFGAGCIIWSIAAVILTMYA